MQAVRIFEIPGTTQQTPLVYCNGICSNHDDEGQRGNLNDQTSLLSSIFSRKLVVFNNPTGLGEFFTNSEEQRQKIDEIATQFARCMREQVEKSGNQRVPVFAHSHGALITKLALEKLQPEIADLVDVYSFGGVVMIPKMLAGNVKNYVAKGDMICRAGNDKFDLEHTLEKIIKLTDRMRLDEVPLEEAVVAQFKEDWFREYQWGPERIPEFVNNFWTGNPDNVAGVEERYTKYASCMRDYDVTLIPCSVKPTLSMKTLTHVTPEMKQHIAGYASAVDTTCHKLFTFRSTLEALAKTL